MSKELGAKLLFLRTRQDFTQSQIAEKLNVDRSTYSNYERAVTEPDIKNLKKLAEIFGVDVNSLLSDAKEKPKVADVGGIPVYTLSKKEKSLLISFRVLTEEQQQQTIDFVDSFSEKKK